MEKRFISSGPDIVVIEQDVLFSPVTSLDVRASLYIIERMHFYQFHMLNI